MLVVRGEVRHGGGRAFLFRGTPGELVRETHMARERSVRAAGEYTVPNDAIPSA